MRMGLGVGYRSGREAKIEVPAGWTYSKERRELAGGKVASQKYSSSGHSPAIRQIRPRMYTQPELN
jgi:hypothetical protein